MVLGDSTWYGLDPRWRKNFPRGQNIYSGCAGAMPFEDDMFDWVMSFSSIEHWGERGDTVEGGLREVYRVLKPGGKMLIHVPLFWHGDKLFLLGSVDAIKRIFESFTWKMISFEEWRLEYEPLPAYRGYLCKRYLRRVIRRHLGKKQPVTWTMEVYAEKLR